jgi:5-methylcytosine-specific restriction endonuclease McrA
MKIMYEDDETEGEDNVKHDVKDIKELTLCEIKKLYPEYEKELRDGVFEKSKNKNGEYQCAICGLTNKTKAPFQVDHIIPMNKGGKTVPENLQILCRHCNGTKGDR